MNKILSMPQVYPVACHTDNVGAGSTFVAIKGQKEDGTRYILDALQKGATTIVVENTMHLSDEIQMMIATAQAEFVVVESSRKALAQLSAQACGYPARKLRIVGVTGTKGKTTSAFLLEHVLRVSGYKTALLSTVYNKILDQQFKTNLTTQHPDYLHNFFSLCVDAGVQIVVMEVAAQATSLHRAEGLLFDGLIFTNFSQEHGEFYPTMDDYFAAKRAIVDQLKIDAPLLLNADDAAVARLADSYPQALLFGINHAADYGATIQANDLEALKITINAPHVSMVVECPSLLGEYNVYNILGVVSLCFELGLPACQMSEAIKTFGAVPGRLERYQLPNGASCFIDYAHNPSSYQAVLSMVRSLTPHLIVVFGCGGERDASKRPIMGGIAAQWADLVILTSDNPRSEDAQSIINDILVGISIEKQSNVICELDRALAIKKAYDHAQAGSVIMLLGKGPDEYQLIGSQKLFFSEAAIVKSL